MSINEILKRAPLNGLGASRQEAEIAKLRRKIAALEKMLLPNQVGVYRAAMRWYAVWSGDTQKSAFGQVTKLARACKKARGK